MKKKTKDYNMFVMRPDNRKEIVRAHVENLKTSIQLRNLLEVRPIDVNAKMEILDGQHRFMAAKELGLDIYYNVSDDLEGSDIILMNIQKSWSPHDYLNYYCKNGFQEYLKMKKFMETHNLSLTVAMNMVLGSSHLSREDFRSGKLKFTEKVDVHFAAIWNTIDLIRKMNGKSDYTESARFWKAMLRLVRHENFDLEKWLANVDRFPDKFKPRINSGDYLKAMLDVYNWRNQNKIILSIGDEKCDI